MQIAAGLDHVRENSRAVLATNRPDGRPQLSPVTVAVVDDDQRCVVRFQITTAAPDLQG